MNNPSAYWDDIYRSKNRDEVIYDNWLEKHRSILESAGKFPIIDLGCGLGNNTKYLIERGFEVIACDYSEEAVNFLKANFPDIETRKFDMVRGLPFPDKLTGLIIADLSIHYFSLSDTRKILSEIARVLTDSGYFLCRVNSIKDVNHGAGCGQEIESHYYKISGYYKRFFSSEHIDEVFAEWSILGKEESLLYRYGKEKVLWEIKVQKKPNYSNSS